eukprot:Hpha_TRINITY_DN14761_c0_g1::TRINITY_DN14761_c0_g1_i3::g.102805::m.102805
MYGAIVRTLSLGRYGATPARSEARAAGDSGDPFTAAQARLKTEGSGISSSDKLALYALFKQATVGPVTTQRPNPIMDYVGAAKWDAWHKLGQMGSAEARDKYIEFADKLVPPTVAAASVAVSRPADKPRSAPAATDPFSQAVERSKHMQSKPSQDDQLKLYALFKQAKDGACKTNRPGVFDIVGRAKWDAWAKLGDMSREDAERTYISLVDSLGAPPYSEISKEEEAAAEEAGAALPRDPATARKMTTRPTLEEVQAHKKRSNDLAYGAERLSAFDGKRPLELFRSPYEVLRWRAARNPAKLAYTHLENGEREGAQLTFGELDKRSRAVAVALQRSGHSAGARVLLLYPQNLEFVSAFFGCLYAGAIAVPSYPPHPARLHRLLPRLLGIIDDCQPAVIATTREIKDMAAMLADQVPQLRVIPMVATDEVPSSLSESWKAPDITRDTPAFLQYTSGSTSAPKGVMVTHFNLVFNLEIFRVAGEMDENEIGVSWCPEFHDLGLIAGILCPAYLGFPLYLMSPEHFLQKPSRWVEMMSKYRGTFSGGANFAFDLTVRKTSAAVRQKVDLSRWRIAFVGAEPVKISTAQSFKAAFPSFPATTFYPGWGLAEATLIIANTLVGRAPSHMVLNATALARHEVVEATDADIEAGAYRSVVSQGVQWLDNELLVMDPDTHVALPHNRVGELIVRGPTVGRGYWNRPEASEEAFGVKVPGRSETWLRTGDLGYILENGEVFICGRRKDVIILAGVNHYPQDFELTCEGCSVVLRKGCGAAFTVDVKQTDHVVIVFEVDGARAQSADLKAVATQMAGAVAENHGVTPSVVGLIPAQAVSKTTAGKIMRRATKATYLSGELEIIAEFRAPGVPELRQKLAVQGREGEDDDIMEFYTPPESPTVEHVAPSGEHPAPTPVQLSAGLAAIRRLSQPPSPCGSAQRTPKRTSPLRLPTPMSSPGASPRIAGSRYTQRDIAVVGIGCRLPGNISSPEQLWETFKEGKCVCGSAPPGRWPPGHGACDLGSFLEDVRSFDHAFFGMTEEEATLTDPQQRILLEVVQEALDDACLSAQRLQGPTGCFVGVSQQEYSRIVDDAGQTATAAEEGGVSNLNDKGMVAGRLAEVFGFRGSARSIDTACSSSLVAVHDACVALSRRECQSAVVAGVNLMLTPDISAAFEHGGFLAPDGLCKTFDASADGYARGEGACAVILKTLDDAIADGDRIYSVVKGSAVNQDGKSNGLTAPNGAAQETCIRQALESSRTMPRQVQYIEAHGTGTALGDPIELKALRNVLGEGHFGADCRVGSAKTNFGHLESAAGILGFIKVSLSLHHREIPASLHYKSPNAHAAFVDKALQKRHSGWPRPSEVLLAGVSSFGFGGTNSHAVLCEAPRRGRRAAQAPPTCNTCYCLPVSHPVGGKGLTGIRDALAKSLSKCDDARAIHLCQAAALRKPHYAVRGYAIGFTREELLESVRKLEPPQQTDRAPPSEDKQRSRAAFPPPPPVRVGFVFSGQGPQWYGMGRRLLHKYAVFHETVQVIDDMFSRVREELGARYPQVPAFSVMEQFTCEEEDSLLRETYAAQPCLFTLQVALAALLRHFGVEPAAVVGHSLGEFAAAVVSGGISLEGAVRIVFIRAALMQKATGFGKMAAIQLSRADEGEELLLAEPGGGVVIAARNSPTHVTVSGESAGVDRVVAEARARGLWVRMVPVNYAFHSPQMAPLAAELKRELQAAQAGKGQGVFGSTFYSTSVSGGVDVTFDEEYWGGQLERPVLFTDAVAAMSRDGITHFVEVSPHPVLRESVASTVPQLEVLACLHRENDEERSLKTLLGSLYQSGVELSWDNVSSIKVRDCGFVRMPRTCWDRKQLWVRDSRILQVDREPGISGEWDD